MSPAIAINYTPPATVRHMLRSGDFVRAIVGPVGSGKSSGCIVEIPRRAVEQAPGPDGIRRTRFAIIRNTYPELRDTTRKTFEQWVPAELGQWHEREFTFHMRFNDVDCEVLFRALDRPEDVKKLLSLELTGAYINEAREIPKSVLDVLQSRVGRYPSKAQGGPTWFGVWMDTNPWPTTSWGYKLFSQDKPEGFALFEQPGGRAANAENVENLPPGYYARLCHGKDQEWIDEYVDGKYPASDRGSVYGHLLADLRERGGVCDFGHERDGVFVFADLGISDSFCFWFMRFGPSRGVDIIDHYEAHGRPLSHYSDLLRSKPYRYERIFLPHDARARTLVTGSTVQEELMKEFPGLVSIVPQVSIADGLQAGRWVLEQDSTRIHSRVSAITGPEDIDGLDALAAYKFEYDENNKVYKKTPLHNWASHTADGFRYLSVAVRFSEYLTRPEPPPPPEPTGPPTYSFPALSSIRSPGRGRL
jgi:hypothetical protein